MTQPKLFMESTEVSADKTAAEIQIALVAAGANKIMNEYAGGQVVGLTFSIVIDGNDVPFSLPVRIAFPDRLFVYILMCRASVGGNVYAQGSATDYWRRWLQAKEENREIGHNVSRALREKYRRDVLKVVSDNRDLKRQVEQMGKFQGKFEEEMAAIGITDFWWRDPGQVARMAAERRNLATCPEIKKLRRAVADMNALLSRIENMSTEPAAVSEP